MELGPGAVVSQERVRVDGVGTAVTAMAERGGRIATGRSVGGCWCIGWRGEEGLGVWARAPGVECDSALPAQLESGGNADGR